MSIQKQFIVRYRLDGHVRFQVPEQLSGPAVAEVVTDKIAEIEGVYRVKIFRRQRKLSIRYQETVFDFVDLVKQLFQIINELDKNGWFDNKFAYKTRQTAKSCTSNVFVPVKNLDVSRWFSEKYGATKETLNAAKIITKLGLKKLNYQGAAKN